MASAEEILKKLRSKADPMAVRGMARYGMSSERRLGVPIPFIRKLAKEVGEDHSKAQSLWATGVPEARILAAMIDEPVKLTEAQMEAWAKDIDSWDICDQVCMNLFERSSLTWKKIVDWHRREEEFVKRAAYALIACLAWHDKHADDRNFIELFPVIKAGATDDRNFVKKAVSWALRNIGKRNPVLNSAAIGLAEDLQGMDSRTAKWIASQCIRELKSEQVQKRLRKKSLPIRDK